MTINAEAKKALTKPAWAIDGDRLDPESTDGGPVIDRSIGFQESFSTTHSINREKTNQLFCELFGAAQAKKGGVLRYDSTISYPPESMVKVNGELYYQASDSSVTNVNPTTAGNTVWRLVAGVSQAERVVPPALGANEIIIDGTRADRFNVRLIIDNTGGYPVDQIRIQHSKDSTFSSGVLNDNDYTQGADILISGRDADLYYVRVKLHNSLGWGNWSSVKDVGSPISPDGPSWVTATPGSSAVVVAWGGSGDNGLTITKHSIEYKTSSQEWSDASSVEVSNSNGYGPGSHTITGLTNGTSYDFRVTAVSNRSTTGTARTASATPVNYPRAPNAPAVGAVALSQTEVLAYISGDTANNGAAISGYKFQKRTAGGTWEAETGEQSTPYYIFTGLAAGGDFEVRARATNSYGDGSQGSAASVSALAVGTPNTPGVVAVRLGVASFVYYAKGDLFDEGGSSITKYRMQYREVGTTDWSTATETANAGGLVYVSNPKKAYELQLGAYNGTNWSAWSPSASLPAHFSTGPSNVVATITSAGVGKVIASVNSDPFTYDVIVGYVWEYKLTSASNWTPIAKQATPTKLIENLTAGASYDFRVKVDDVFGTTTSAPVTLTVADYASPSFSLVRIDSQSSPELARRRITVAQLGLNTGGASIATAEWQLRMRQRATHNTGSITSWSAWQPATNAPTRITLRTSPIIDLYFPTTDNDYQIAGELGITPDYDLNAFQWQIRLRLNSGDWVVYDFNPYNWT